MEPEKLSYHEVIQNPKEIENINSNIHIVVNKLHNIFSENKVANLNQSNNWSLGQSFKFDPN